MSQYERIPNDLYPSDPWVIPVLLKHYHVPGRIWEPAAGQNHMVDALRAAGREVHASDILTGQDFRDVETHAAAGLQRCRSIVSNFPYRAPLVDEMLEQAMRFVGENRGVLALLFYHTFDGSSKRKRLFSGNPHFAMKIVLTQRMYVPGLGRKASPMRNHAWYIWDYRQVQSNTTVWE